MLFTIRFFWRGQKPAGIKHKSPFLLEKDLHMIAEDLFLKYFSGILISHHQPQTLTDSFHCNLGIFFSMFEAKMLETSLLKEKDD